MDKPFLQRRYLLSFDTRRIGHIFTDVLVIGAGAAGLRAALASADRGAHTLVLTKGELAQSNTYEAQGGIAAVIDNRVAGVPPAVGAGGMGVPPVRLAGVSPADSIDDHVADTVACAAGLGDLEVIRRVVGAGPDVIAELVEWGMPVDREEGAPPEKKQKKAGGTPARRTGGTPMPRAGETPATQPIALGREGGHSASRIVHAHGDATGKYLSLTLIAKTKTHENIKIFENCFVVDLLTDGDDGQTVVGAVTYHTRYGLQMIWARQTILAAGGAGILWRETTNPPSATADAAAIAFRAGVELADMEMMQFHPTTLYVAGATRALISEAVRGEGAYLVDRTGCRFMADYSDKLELAARDLVSRAILAQMAKTNSTHVFLDVRHIGTQRFRRRFPHIFRLCQDFDIDVGKDLIPVHPAAHYMIGGVRTDAQGRSSLAGLWACGEAASTGLHGANRLASNSLLEALVIGKTCGDLAAQAAGTGNETLTAAHIVVANPKSERTLLDLTDIRNSLRSVMWRNAGIIRSGPRLEETREIIRFWGRYVLDKEFFDPAGWEVQNMLTSALLVVELAMRRTETRGVHYRSDFPQTDPAWARRQTVRRTPEALILG